MDSVDNGRDSLCYRVEMTAVASSGKWSPFWLQSNRYGNISAQPYSGVINAYIGKEATRPNRWFDYDFGVEIAGRIDTKKATGYLQQLYAHTRLYVFDITAGIKPVTYGNQDDELGTGGFLYSRNAHPIPRITIGIDNYTPFPFTYGYFEVKGGLTHAWVTDNAYVKNYYLHHLFAAGRLGGKLPVNVSYEFHHIAQWGGVSPTYGDLSRGFSSFVNTVLGRSGGKMNNDIYNTEGNHILLQCLGVDVKVKPVTISLYWQSLLEDPPVYFMGRTMNKRDGLWGISIRQTAWRFISGFTYEFLNTTHQSGQYHDLDGFGYSGADNYFNNNVYRNGWSYFGRTIGTPFITSHLYTPDAEVNTTNNRVRVHHIGIKGDIYSFQYRLMASYTRNWGRCAEPIKTDNTALLLEVEKHVEKAWGLDFSLSLGADIGSQFGNSFGAMLTVRKQGLICSWK